MFPTLFTVRLFGTRRCKLTGGKDRVEWREEKNICVKRWGERVKGGVGGGNGWRGITRVYLATAKWGKMQGSEWCVCLCVKCSCRAGKCIPEYRLR